MGRGDRAMPSEADAPPAAARAGLDFDAVFSEHFETVWRSLAYLGVREADLDDETQNVFVVCLRHLDRYDPALGSVRAWLGGIAVRVASDYRRKAHRHHEQLAEVIELSAGEPDADQRVALKQDWQLLAAALSALPFDQRTVLVMSDLEDISLREIGQALDISINTAGSRLRLAREKLSAAAARIRARRGEP